MNSYAYFLGCITPNRYPGIEAATKKVLKALDIDIRDVKGASCCPAPGVIGSFDLLTWLVIAARNLSIAEEMNRNIVVTCNGCYATLQEACYLLAKNNGLKSRVNNILEGLGKTFRGTVEVKHVVEVLEQDVGYDAIREKVIRPLNGIRVAVHYGCHFLKPSEFRKHGSWEKPMFLDKLVTEVGAHSVDYRHKMMCCGAGGGVRSAKKELTLKILKEKIEGIIDAKADCIITPCAFCHLQFDTGQVELTQKLGKKYEVPTVFVTQLLGLALGMSAKELGLYENRTQVESFMKKLGR